MADYSLNGCGWVHFDKLERKSSISLLANEVDISCEDIIEAQSIGSQLNIESLRELQVQDALTREKFGVDKYAEKLSGQSSESSLEWENYDKMVTALNQRLEDINASSTPGQLLPHIAQAKRTTGSDCSQPHALSQSSQLQPLKGPKFSSLSFEQEVSLTVENVTQEDQEEAYIQASNRLKDSGDWITLNSAQRIIDACTSVLDGPEAAVLMTSSPPTKTVVNTVGVNVPMKPFYGNENDVPFFPFTHTGREFHLKGLLPSHLPGFKFSRELTGNLLQAYMNDYEDEKPPEETFFQLASLPPSWKEVRVWKNVQMPSTKQRSFALSSLPSFDIGDDDLTAMCVEVFTSVRPGMTPFSELDAVEAVIWSIRDSMGVITTKDIPDALVVSSELEIIENLVRVVQKLDPDLLLGFETTSLSWGFIAARYTFLTDDVLDVGRLKQGMAFSRMEPIIFPGRYLLNLWTILRHEINLYKYTLEVAVYEIFHHRTPHYSFENLYEWWNTGSYERVIKYFQRRINLTFKVVDHLEIISKYSEQARIIGIDFYSCLTRGSQFKVESMLCRLSKSKNFRLISPSRHQVSEQAALERIPLVMEPQSAFYTDPVCVLDFRSLYPSIIIAFNLCYSTCIGRLELWKGKNKLGVLPDLKVPPGLEAKDVFIAANGIGYVKPHVRRSVLATMLKEILESRFMIKSSMKFNKNDARYQRNLNGKQAALKFIANVTYGYVSASFSGRMPCAEIADTIVSTGRELLVKSINIIEAQTQWGIKPKVVYGDTDSLFVRLPGASKSQAFEIGQELANIVTEAFPSPIELELEKIYKPCILLTKKRYVGLSYESPSSKAYFDAKGTETIRRDGTPIEQKLERGALDRLFADADLSKVKRYLQKQWRSILDGKVILNDFCFSQQVKLGHYKGQKSNLPGGAVVSLKRATTDKGSLPQYKERVSFIISAGMGNINDRAVPPEQLVHNPDMMIDAQYYITKNIIPPLERMFNIFGADVRSWYNEMSKSNRSNSAYKTQCLVCLDRSHNPLCPRCESNAAESLYILYSRQNSQDRKFREIEELCFNCSGKLGQESCESLDCDVYYERERSKGELRALTGDIDSVDQYLSY